MNLKENLKTIQEKIIEAEVQFKRPSNSVQLMAVSKTQTSDRIRELWQCGQEIFGENYLQEALPKITALQDTTIQWHFIGPVQKNKTRKIAEHFSWVHSVDNDIIAQRLNDHRPASLPALNICIQMNMNHEPTKSGILPSHLFPLIQKIGELSRLILRGFMIIPEPLNDFTAQCKTFRSLHQLLNQANQEWKLSLDTLSMGMSNDYIAAIAEGSTIIRLGTALFGSRL